MFRKLFPMNFFYRDALSTDGGGIAEVTKAVGELKTAAEKGQKAVKEQIEGVATEVSTVKDEVKTVKDEQETIKADIKAIKARTGRSSNMQKNAEFDYNDRVKALVIENGEKLKAIYDGSLKSHSFRIETKDATDTTAPNSLTGDYPKQYANEIISMPSRKTHLRQLFGVGGTSDRTYTYYREEAPEGSVASQTAEGAKKSKIKFNFTEVDANVKTIAGFSIVSLQLLNNLPALWAFLQKRMPELYYREEDRQLFSGTGINGELPGLLALIASATSTDTDPLGYIMDTIAEIEDTDEDVNTILLRPSTYMNVLKVGTLNKPDVVVIDPSTGRLTIAGIPAYKSTAVPVNGGVIGDFNLGADILQLEALNVAVSLEDGENFQNNTATIKVEAQVAFPIFRPGAFRKLNFGATT